MDRRIENPSQTHPSNLKKFQLPTGGDTSRYFSNWFLTYFGKRDDTEDENAKTPSLFDNLPKWPLKANYETNVDHVTKSSIHLKNEDINLFNEKRNYEVDKKSSLDQQQHLIMRESPQLNHVVLRESSGSNANNLPSIIGAAVGIIILIAVLCVAIVYYRRWRERKLKEEAFDPMDPKGKKRKKRQGRQTLGEMAQAEWGQPIKWGAGRVKTTPKLQQPHSKPEKKGMLLRMQAEAEVPVTDKLSRQQSVYSDMYEKRISEQAERHKQLKESLMVLTEKPESSDTEMKLQPLVEPDAPREYDESLKTLTASRESIESSMSSASLQSEHSISLGDSRIEVVIEKLASLLDIAPEKLHYPSDYVGCISFKMEYDEKKQSLMLTIAEANNLPELDVMRSSDPYVKIMLYPDKKT